MLTERGETGSNHSDIPRCSIYRPGIREAERQGICPITTPILHFGQKTRRGEGRSEARGCQWHLVARVSPRNRCHSQVSLRQLQTRNFNGHKIDTKLVSTW